VATLFGAVYLLPRRAKVNLVYFVSMASCGVPWLIGLLGVFIIFQLYVIALVKFSWWLVA
jgi:hypothetical protein